MNTEKRNKIIDRTASLLKFTAGVVVPLSVSALTKAATSHIAPAETTSKVARVTFKVGEYFLAGLLSHQATKYVERSIDEFVEDFKEGLDSVIETLESQKIVDVIVPEGASDESTSLTEEDFDRILDETDKSFTDEMIYNALPSHLQEEFDAMSQEDKKAVLAATREQMRAKLSEMKNEVVSSDDS